MFRFFKYISNAIYFMQLPHEQRRLTFYSEGKNYWPYLEGIIKEVLNTTDLHICYISSDESDPGLKLDNEKYHTYVIDEGFVRNWLFENIQTDVMVMTMPDINQFQVKRSKYKVHYIYVQHSLVSLHMVYRKGAFDHYDTIFCAGEHHIKEIRAMEKLYNLPQKKLLKHGYTRLDAIIEESKKRVKKEKKEGEPLHILVAPTWGENGTIEFGLGEKIVDALLEQGYRVTLRPHPQTIKHAKDKIEKILKKYQNNTMFDYEGNVAGQDSLHESDVMISDWSGVALDYAFGLNKPVWFVDVPKKVNNPDYKELGIEPFEVMIREKIGEILDMNDLDFKYEKKEIDEKLLPYNIGQTYKVAKDYIMELLK